MFGFDEDDPGIFERTVDFLEWACVDVATVSMVVPMPGTPTFLRLRAEGRILTEDWSQYDGKKHCVFRPKRMSPEELVAGTEWAARRFYSLASIYRRLKGSRAGIWWNAPRNLGYHLALRQFAFRGWNPARRVTGTVGPGSGPASTCRADARDRAVALTRVRPRRGSWRLGVRNPERSASDRR